MPSSSAPFTALEFQETLSVSHETMEKLEQYHALLLKWQKAINLVSPATLQDSWHRHFLDSAQISSFIPAGAKTLIDLGSGAGFPGMVLAILRPEINITLIESDERKTQFLHSVSRETSTPVSISHARIENTAPDISPDFVTARALAPLRKLLDYAHPWALCNPALEMCFLKGAHVAEEIGEARKTYTYDLEVKDSLTDSAAKILCIRRLACA